MKKRRHQKVRRVDKAAAGKLIYTRLFCSRTTDLPADKIEDVMAPFTANLYRLERGMLTTDYFVELNQCNIMGFCLAALTHKNGTAETQALVEPSQAVFHRSADVLAEIGERYGKTGKYVAKAEELAALNEAHHWTGELLKVSSEGIALQALLQAEQMVNDKLKEIAK